MSIHVVRKNGFKYTFYDDETFNLYMSGEAYFDEGQTLRKRKGRGNICNRVKVEPDDRPIVIQKRPTEEHPIRDAAIDILRDVVHMGIDKLVYDELPYLWYKKIKPGIDDLKEYKKNGCKTKAELILERSQAQENTSSTQLSAKLKPERSAKSPMTEKEILDEQRKAVLHYIGLLESLTKLHNAGVIDRNSVLEQLTNPAAIEQFNQTISANPNLLEMTQHLELTNILERDLFQSGKFVPIEVKEIEKIATKNNQEDM